MLRLNRLDLGGFFFFFAWFLTLAMLFSEREREKGGGLNVFSSPFARVQTSTARQKHQPL